MTFAYGDKQHAVSVLIDHGRGGKIKDTWVAKGTGLRADTEQAAWGDPLVVFEAMDAPMPACAWSGPSAPASARSSPIRSTTWWPTALSCAPGLDLLAGRAAPYPATRTQPLPPEERPDQREHQVGPPHDAHVGGAGQHRELRAGDQPVHLHRMLEADEVMVAEHQQGRRGDSAELVGRPALEVPRGLRDVFAANASKWPGSGARRA